MAGTKRLFLLRHAKSSWDDPGLEDRDRPLSPRGRRAVEVLAEHLRVSKIEPQLILCSGARRTVETLEGLGLPGDPVIDDGLYAASPSALLERLRQIADDVTSAIVIGHNPTMQVLVLRLAATGLNGFLEEVQRKFPTGALATLEFECGWSELAPGGARLTSYIRAKQLARG